MTTRRRCWLIALAAALLLLLAAMFAARQWQRSAATEYNSFPSPDGQYRVVVYSLPSLIPVMPGQGGDAGGYVRLLDRSGRVLHEKPIDMVQSIQTVEWEPGRVYIKLFAEWPLPPQSAAPPAPPR